MLALPRGYGLASGIMCRWMSAFAVLPHERYRAVSRAMGFAADVFSTGNDVLKGATAPTHRQRRVSTNPGGRPRTDRE